MTKPYVYLVIPEAVPDLFWLRARRINVPDVYKWLNENDVQFEHDWEILDQHFRTKEYVAWAENEEDESEEPIEHKDAPGVIYNISKEDTIFEYYVFHAINLADGRWYAHLYHMEESALDPIYADTLEEMDELVLEHCKYIYETSQDAPVWIAPGIEDKAYGGPEEGGWYYDTFELKQGPGIPVMTCVKRGDLECYEDEMKDWCDAQNVDRPEISSVLSEGRWSYRIFEEVPHSTPKERPRYE